MLICHIIIIQPFGDVKQNPAGYLAKSAVPVYNNAVSLYFLTSDQTYCNHKGVKEIQWTLVTPFN